MERDSFVSPALALRASLELRCQKSNHGHPEGGNRKARGSQAMGFLESPLVRHAVPDLLARDLPALAFGSPPAAGI